MQTLISSVVKRLRKVYQKAEEFIEEEREFSLSQVFVNATMERYVTEKVEIIKENDKRSRRKNCIKYG